LIVGRSLWSGLAAGALALACAPVCAPQARAVESVRRTAPGPIADRLREMGIRAIFGPGSPTSETVEFLRQMNDGEPARRGVAVKR